MSITNILNLDENSDTNHNQISFENPTEESLKEIIFDLDIDLDIRMKALEIYNKEYPSETFNILNLFITMFLFSQTTLLFQFLCHIAKHSNLKIEFKIEIGKCLSDYSENKQHISDGFKILCSLCDHKEFSTLTTPYKVDAICCLMKSGEYKLECENYFCNIVNDTHIECDYRYKTILSLEHKIENKDLQKHFLSVICLSFLRNKLNHTRYRILSAQYLLQRCKIQPSNEVESYLVEFAQDGQLDYNIRADASDVLLQLGSEENKLIARELIMLLSRVVGPVRTIFDNAQNVHVEEIEESVITMLEFLHSSIHIKTTFEQVQKEIKTYIETYEIKENIEKITTALNRIYMDRALYGKFNSTLVSVFLQIWTYIHLQEEHKDEMFKRLIEELIEMSGTCSTGYVSRLVNSISGFGDFNLRISWEDQIKGNFAGRINARIRAINDEEEREYILTEMILAPSDYENRKHFLKFLRENFLAIREELYNEFREHIDDASFDLGIRRALLHYECGEIDN